MKPLTEPRIGIRIVTRAGTPAGAPTKTTANNALTIAVILGLFLAAILPLVPSPAYANSARTHWEGVSATGAIVSDESGSDCPIQVQHESLTFDIDSFPREYYNQADDDAYDAKVTAEYTFHNPADYGVTATLLFPFGKLPDYRLDSFDESNDSSEGEPNDPSKEPLYGISINGEPVESTVRHTLSYMYEDFDLSTSLSRMANDYVEDPFFALELPVTTLVFRFSGIPEGNNSATAGFYWTASQDGKILLVNQSGLQDAPREIAGTAEGADANAGADAGADVNASADAAEEADSPARKLILSTWAENGETATVHLFGAAADDDIVCELFVNGSCEQPLEGDIELIERTTSSFARLALSKWSEESGVLPHDWYNAIVAHLNYCERYWGGGVGDDGLGTGVISESFSGELFDSLDLTGSLLRWYEYRIAIDSGETLINTVTAPLYPSIDASYNPAVYQYTYLLSPARTWSSFGTLDISINTPFYLIESVFDNGGGNEADNPDTILETIFSGGTVTRNKAGFETMESPESSPTSANPGYLLSVEGLPDGELVFSLSASETPRAKRTSGSETMTKFIVIVVAACAVVLGAVAVKTARRKNNG